MKHVSAAILGVALIAGISTVSSPTARARGLVSAPCTRKTTRIDGKFATVNCGPAVATLTMRGKTFTFRHGICERSLSGGVAIALGTLVQGTSTNAGRPYISIGSDKTGARIAEAFFGGKALIDFSSIKVSGRAPLKARFHGVTDQKSFTGTWDCHGRVYQ
jgi:hypothetical protein